MVIRVGGYLTFRKLVGNWRVEVGRDAPLRGLLRTVVGEIGDPAAREAFGGKDGPAPGRQLSWSRGSRASGWQTG